MSEPKFFTPTFIAEEFMRVYNETVETDKNRALNPEFTPAQIVRNDDIADFFRLALNFPRADAERIARAIILDQVPGVQPCNIK